jgi:hypothetical protein
MTRSAPITSLLYQLITISPAKHENAQVEKFAILTDFRLSTFI